MPDVYRLTPMLHTNDLQRTIDFYTDTLGFRLSGTWPEEGAPTWCSMHAGPATIMFNTFLEGENPEPSLTGRLYLYPDEVARMWQRLRDAAPIAAPLHVTEYGMREFTITDPNGYLVTFGEPSAEAPSTHHDRAPEH